MLIYPHIARFANVHGDVGIAIALLITTKEGKRKMTATQHYELKDREFRKISSIVYDACRINLRDAKKELVQARLAKRLRALGMDSYGDYLDLIEKDACEHTIMIDYLSTNLTMFFRERGHFNYLAEEVFPRISESSTGRIWSAGCSSGEEAYTLAMLLRENLLKINLMDCLILATDISTRMLEAAKRGVYTAKRMENVPEDMLEKYFRKTGRAEETFFEAGAALKSLIRFRYLNLIGPWPMDAKFDAILCRNVMIYFDKPTQQELVARFYNLLKPGGIFIVGHSESLVGINHDYTFVRPSIYKRPAGEERVAL